MTKREADPLIAVKHIDNVVRIEYLHLSKEQFEYCANVAWAMFAVMSGFDRLLEFNTGVKNHPDMTEVIMKQLKIHLYG